MKFTKIQIAVAILLALIGLTLGSWLYLYITTAKPQPVSAQQIDTKQAELIKRVQEKSIFERETFDPEINQLHIPKLSLMEKVYVSDNPQDIDLGVWLEKDGSQPDKGSNTILTAHRWGRKSKNPFFYLDKLEVGDEINFYWQNQLYYYVVKETKVVDPDAIEILEPSDDSILTLYTCTPLFSDVKRLVIVAELEKVEVL